MRKIAPEELRLLQEAHALVEAQEIRLIQARGAYQFLVAAFSRFYALAEGEWVREEDGVIQESSGTISGAPLIVVPEESEKVEPNQ